MRNPDVAYVWKALLAVTAILVSCLGGLLWMGYAHTNLPAHPRSEERVEELRAGYRVMILRQEVMMEAILDGTEDPSLRRRLRREFYMTRPPIGLLGDENGSLTGRVGGIP